jgi:hypothetical protein
MAKQSINVGTAANDKKGDSLRAAFQKVNANFTELYTELGLVVDANLNLGAFEFAGSTISTTDSSAIVIDQSTTITSNLSVGGDIVPQTANGGDLGSSTLPWRSLYVSGSTIYIGGNSLSINNQGELTFNNNRVAHENGEFMTLDNLSDLNVNNPNAGDTIAWAGYQWVNVPLTQDRLADDGDEVVLIGGANPYVTFPAITGGDQLIIQGAEVSSVSGSLALTSQDNLNIIANGSGAAPGGSKNWTFSADGSLTIPGDIRSDSNINIEINLSDSTLRRWQFGEDGELTLPEDAVIKTMSGNLTIEGESYVIIDSATNGQIDIGRSSGVGAVSLGNKSNGTNVVVDDLFVANGVYEFFSSLADATGVVTHNCANGHIFYHTSPDANWTVNLTNLLDTWNRATSVTLIIAQGAIGYYPSAVQIAGVAQTLNWQGNATPTPSTNRTDVVTFSIINNSGTYTVLGQLTGF